MIIFVLICSGGLFLCGVHYERARVQQFEPHRPRLLPTDDPQS